MKPKLSEMEKFLGDSKIPIRLAFKTKSNWPLIISLWFLYRDGLIYCATQESAKIVSHLKNDPQCAFEISGDYPPYCGVRGKALARIDKSLGAEILEQLLSRYLGGFESDLAQTLLSKKESEVAIVLDPTWISTWNFSDRMKHLNFEIPDKKICP